jgi:midasin
MKARKICRETILSTPYAKSVQTLDGLITEVIETSNHLKNLEVSADLPKSKQKSQAKNFLQQKRKALADLFRTLQQIGLSYRTGLMYWNTGEVGTYEFTLPPIDLQAAFQHLKNRYVQFAEMNMVTLQLV